MDAQDIIDDINALIVISEHYGAEGDGSIPHGLNTVCEVEIINSRVKITAAVPPDEDIPEYVTGTKDGYNWRGELDFDALVGIDDLGVFYDVELVW